MIIRDHQKKTMKPPYKLAEQDNLFCQEEHGQIMITASSTDQICLNIEEAYALALWLVAAASRIEGRYPEMVGTVV